MSRDTLLGDVRGFENDDTGVIMHTIIGVDGCYGGWVAVYYTAGQEERIFDSLVDNDFSKLIANVLCQCNGSEDYTIAVDIPIGLAEGRRECDIIAKSMLKKRHSCVFYAPSATVLKQWVNEEPVTMSRQLEGIMGKIVEANSYIEANTDTAKHIYEVHPELCFLMMNDSNPVIEKKRLKEGQDKRKQLLKRVGFIGIGEIEELHKQAKKMSTKELMVERDDTIDALAACWTAERLYRKCAMPIPKCSKNDERRVIWL